jgi:hypothetical protein
MIQEESPDLQEQENQIQTSFDYAALDEATRVFVQQKTEETHLYLGRTAASIVQVGQNLQAVKQRLGHGHFLAWLHAEFGMTYQTARNCMRVAERFGDKVKIILTLPSTVLYLLAQPSTSEAIIEQVESGELAPTVEAIKAARQAEQEAKAEAAQANQRASLWQAQATHTQENAQKTEDALQAQIDALQAQLVQRPEPEVMTKEVEVIPPATQAELSALREQVATLTSQRDALSKQAEILGEQARAAALHEDDRPREQVTAQWQRRTQETLHILSQLLISWPSPLDAYHFQPEDWRRLSQIEEYTSRLQSACAQLRETVNRTVSAQTPIHAAGEEHES